MEISAETSGELAQVILAAAGDHVSAEGPLKVHDRDTCWLVVGPALKNESPGIACRDFYIFVKKNDGEVIGIGYCIELEESHEVEAAWKQHATPTAIAIWDNRPEVVPATETLDLYAALHGGLINQPDDAVAYAGTLLGLSNINRQNLVAMECRGVWKVTAAGKPICDFSRQNGKITFMSH